jgi:4-alpha-glucanotransferase
VQRGVSRRTSAALRDILRRPPGRRRDAKPIVLGRRGDALPAGSELVLEDGTELGARTWIPQDMPFGYHHLRSGRHDQLLIVAPRRCPLPAGYREWAWAVQLYATRSKGSWGIGDLGDLWTLATWSGEVGAGALIVSPMGAPNPGPEPEASPYFPSTRRFRDPLLVRIQEVPGAHSVAHAIAPLAAEGRRLNQRRSIDRRAALALKRSALDAIWTSGGALSGEVGDRVKEFTAAGEDALRRWATFAALSEELGPDWRSWPEPYRSPSSLAVGQYADENPDRIGFHTWVQWLVDEQLAAAAAAGPRIVTDVPVGFDPGGFDAWDWQELLAEGVSVGAPPDPFNPNGQDWGLPPFAPNALREVHLRPFIATLRAALRHAGGLRIDHILGFFRQWWIPSGFPAAGGAFVRYPFEELLAVVTIESVRAGAIVIGEDLGTVEPGVRHKLAARGILSTRVAAFEARHPDAYPRGVLATITDHDLPTIAGTWSAHDLEDQRAAGIQADAAHLAWWRDRVARLAGLPPTAPRDEVILAAHRALAASPATLVSATLEDALRVRERPNIPGTGLNRLENWSLALPVPLEELAKDPFAAKLAGAMRRHPGRSAG